MKFNLPFGKTEKKEFFLSLILHNEKINAVFFEEVEGEMQTLASSSSKFEDSIENASLEELLTTADKAISQAEQKLSQKLETVKTIFAVKVSWVQEDKIKKEYLEKLKKISDELGLIPIGFIVIYEAISYLLEKEEGAPISAIIAEKGDKFISAALIKAGKIKEFKTSEITESPAETLDNVLKHFSAETFPQRILILGESKDESQEFLKHKWSQSLPFLHLPQVSTLEADFDAKAVLFGSARQLGFEMLDSEIPQEETIDKDFKEEEKPEEEDEEIDGKIKLIPPEGALEYFGFFKNQDVEKEKINEKEGERSAQIPQETLKESIEEIPEEIKEEQADKKQLPVNAAFIMTGGRNFLSKMTKALKLPGKGLSSYGISPRNKFLLIPLLLIIILLVTSYFYYLNNSATVTLNINADLSEKAVDVIFSQNKSSDPEKGILASKFLSVTEEGTASTQTSGKKETGEKAKGKVTIFNNDSAPKNLSSGTTITSSGGIDFTLDDSVTIASASGDVFSGTTPGKKDVSVTAKEIGTESNLPSNTKFTIGSGGSIAAKNDNAFSGGTKKEITVVAKEDIEDLKKTIVKNLESKAKENLKNKISDDDILLPVLISGEIIKSSFDKKDGEEAKNVALKATVEYKGISYKKSDSVEFANEILKNSISDNQTVSADNIAVGVSSAKQDDETVTAKIKIKGFVVPKIDEGNIKKEISGKSFSDAEEILKGLDQVSSAEINLALNLPLLPKLLPFSSDKIKLQAKINE